MSFLLPDDPKPKEQTGELGSVQPAIPYMDEAGHWGDNPPCMREYGNGCPKSHAHRIGPHTWEYTTTDGTLTTLTYPSITESLDAWNAGKVLPL